MFSAYGEGMPMDQFRKDPIDKVLASVIWDLDYAKGIVRAASETDGSKKQLNNGLNALHMLHEKVRAQIQDWHWAGDLAPRVYVAVRAHEHLRSALQRNSIEAEFLKPIQDFGENIAKMDSIVLSTKDPSNILDLSVILEALYQKCWQLTKDIQQHQCGDGELQNMLANSTKVREAIQLQEVLLIATGILKTRGTLTR